MAVVSSSSSSSMWVFFFLLLALFIHLQVAMATTTPQISHLRNVEVKKHRLPSLQNSSMAERALEAEKLNEQAAVANPEEVVSMVEMSIQNSTQRRNLGFFSCGTGNPIDDCWRCDPNWQRNRKRLADCGIGFGRNAIGGRDGKFYVVTDPRDDDPVNPKPGTLRHAVIQDRPLWIVFKRDMVIQLKQELIMNSFKTIDGRGANGNRYNAPVNPFAKEVTKRVETAESQWKGWNWRSEGDLLLNGAFFTPSGAGASASYARASSLGAKSSSMVGSMTSNAGALGCKRGRQC
ncbi:pectate lyase [Vigna angularis]|uniref:Pectate lyase n=1 Tax=Phaseolus angularis TaxID=3914 RepID=A0A8T0KW71_PHAAN|nr:pectate lyase [Vigna angularis]